MASLSDVWVGESPEEVPTVPTKRATAMVASDEKLPVAQEKSVLLHLEALVMEVHELRREQARRCTVYMILVGILFATLILYIDRLQTQVKSLRHSRDISSRPERMFGPL
jgi:hypothetical protein